MAKPPKKYDGLTKEQKKFLKKMLGIKKLEDLDVAILKQLKEKLKALKDVRNKNMLIYKLWDVIMCVIIDSFANNNTWDDVHQFDKDNYTFLNNQTENLSHKKQIVPGNHLQTILLIYHHNYQ